MAKIAPYTGLDFAQVKRNLLDHLRNQEQFKGYDFSGSNLNVLVDIMAYNAYNNMQYYNMTLGETFLDSAQLKNSIISHAKELNYLPRSRRSSGALVKLRIISSSGAGSFNIPRGTPFLGRCGNASYTFITNKSYVAPRIAPNVYEIDDVAIFEGRIINELLDLNNTTLSNSFIDTRSIRLFVNGEEFRFTSGVFGVTENDKVYYLQPELNDKYSIQFGQTLFGYQPTASDVIQVQYRVSSGTQANGIKAFNTSSLPGASSVTITPTSSSVGGAEAESIESVKAFAPKAFQVQNRAVTASDYEVLLKTQFPEIESISVFGGDETYPPQFGRVIIAVDVQGRDGAAKTELQLYKDYIKTKSPLTIEPIFQEAKFMFGKTTIDVAYSRNDIMVSDAGLKTKIMAQLEAYNTINLNKFNGTVSLAELGHALSTVDPSILSVSANVEPTIDYQPALNKIESPTFAFSEELIKPYPYVDAQGPDDFKPALSSTKFTIDDKVVQLQDDGKGTVQAIIANDSQRAIFKNSIGTINYLTGEVVLRDLIIRSYEGNAIQVSVKTKNRDFTSPKDRIFKIRTTDTVINTRPV